MTNYTIFISDLHLYHDQPKTTELFLNFLQTDALQAEAIYILGDLFKFWIGDDDNSTYVNTIKNALKQTSTHVPIYLMPGNRDFLLGNKFARESGCIPLQDPTVINLYSTPTLLTHGDSLCSGDYLHLVFRFITRPALATKLFLKLPFAFRAWIATNMQRFSAYRKNYRMKNKSDETKIDPEKALLKFGATQLIYGHTHKSKISNCMINNQTARTINLGEWTEGGGEILIYYKDNTCSINKFPKT